MRTPAFLWGALQAVILRSAGFALAFLLTLVIARNHTPEQTGIFFWIIAITSLLSTLGCLGVGNIIIRSTASLTDDKPEQGLRFYHALLIGLAGLCVATCIQMLLAANYDAARQEALLLSAPSVLLIGAATLNSYFIQGSGRIRASIFFLTIAIPGLTLAAAALTDDINRIYLLRTFAAAAVLLATALMILPHIRLPALRVDTSVLRSILASSTPLFVVSLCTALMQWGGQIYIGFWLPAEDSAYFAIAQRLSLIVSFILIGLNTYIAPRFARLYHTGEFTTLRALYHKSMLVSAVAAFSMTLAMLAFSEHALAFFADEFVAARSILAILLIGQLINGLTGSCAQLVNMSGHEKSFRNCMLASALLFMLLLASTTPYFGVMGAALSTSLALAFQNILLFFFAQKIMSSAIARQELDQ